MDYYENTYRILWNIIGILLNIYGVLCGGILSGKLLVISSHYAYNYDRPSMVCLVKWPKNVMCKVSDLNREYCWGTMEYLWDV